QRGGKAAVTQPLRLLAQRGGSAGKRGLRGGEAARFLEQLGAVGFPCARQRSRGRCHGRCRCCGGVRRIACSCSCTRQIKLRSCDCLCRCLCPEGERFGCVVRELPRIGNLRSRPRDGGG